MFANLEHIKEMLHSPIYNYIVPGLTSWLIGERSERGCMRMFICDRKQQVYITPHSHRFDLLSVVIEGSVSNTLWRFNEKETDCFTLSTLEYRQQIGRYDLIEESQVYASAHLNQYSAGMSYFMMKEEIHSIVFSKGAKVLIFEGPQLTNRSYLLEPFVNNETIRTGEVKDWMFKRS